MKKVKSDPMRLILALLIICATFLSGNNLFSQDLKQNILKERIDSNGVKFQYDKNHLSGSFDGTDTEKVIKINKLLSFCNASMVVLMDSNPKEQYVEISFKNPDADSYLYLKLFRESSLFHWINIPIPTLELGNDNLMKEYYDSKPLNKNDR